MEKSNMLDEDDAKLWDMWMSVFYFPVISVSDELGYFEFLGNEERQVIDIANELNITLRAVETLTNTLTSLGFVQKKDSTVSLLPISKKHLLQASPFYWGNQIYAAREMSMHKKILDAIKNSSPQLKFVGQTFTNMWEEGTVSVSAAIDFTQKMQVTHLAAAEYLAQSGAFDSTVQLLDIGSGSGCFSIAFLEKYPNARATLFDLPTVCEVSKKYFINTTIEKNLTLNPGNIFKDLWPKNHDTILLSQILHDWNHDMCRKILKLVYDTLEVDGKIFIHEMLLDESKISPRTTVFFDLLMFINHQSQQFTKNELFNLLEESGFRDIKSYPMFGYFSLVTALK